MPAPTGLAAGSSHRSSACASASPEVPREQLAGMPSASSYWSPPGAGASVQASRPSQSGEPASSQRLIERPLQPGDTTLLVRNVPARYSQEQLLEEWELVGDIDLFFLPFRCRGRRTAGYVIINFLSPASADAFLRRWQGQFLQHTQRARPLEVGRSKIQGFGPSMLHMANSTAQDSWGMGWLPLVFEGRQRRDAAPILLQCSRQAQGSLRFQ